MQKNGRTANWFEYSEQKKTLLVGGIIIISLAMLAVTVRRNNVSFDSWWHLKLGLDWLESGLSMWRDRYSFTFYGEEVAGPPYLFQILLAWLVTNFGLVSGFELYKFGSNVLVLALVTFFLRKLRTPVVVYCLVLPLLVVLLQLRAIVRPELISYSFCVLAVMLYYRARSGLSAANMLPIVALMLLWCNYHSPIFGYIIFFGYFVDTALQQVRNRAPTNIWLKWLGWGVAVVAVGYLCPDFNHPLIHLFHFSAEWKDLIMEYLPATVLYGKSPAIYILIAVALITLVLLLKKREFGLLFVCTLLIFFSVDMVRLVTPSGIVVLCIFAWMVSEIDLGKQLQNLPRGLNQAIGAAVMVSFVISLASSVNVARSYMEENRRSGDIFPEDVADYMISQTISGRIFNDYGIGGYLIYRLSPNSQVYIDGRTDILYPVDHFNHHSGAEKSPDILRAEIEKYDIDLAILKNTQRNYSLVRDAGTHGLDYPGIKFSLFRRDNPNFPLLGTLLAYPACWNGDMSSALEEEQNKAISILPDSSSMLLFINFVIEYANTDDKIEFLSTLEEDIAWTVPMLRFAGFQALILNLDSIAHELFAGIRAKTFGDFLGGALAQARLGEWRNAEKLLDAVTKLTWSENKSEISILYGLLVSIRENTPLELIEDSYVNRLGDEIGANNDSFSSSTPNPRSFCPDA